MNTAWFAVVAVIVGLCALVVLGNTARLLQRKLNCGVEIRVNPCEVESSGNLELVYPVCAAKLKVKVTAEGEA